MLLIYQEMVRGFRMIFPRKKFRWLLIILSGVAAGIAISELLVIKLFSEIIIRKSDIEEATFKILLVSFLIFFLITRLGQYFQRSYRVKAFEKNFKFAGERVVRKNENAEWVMAFELTNILSYFTQIIAILVFFIFISPFLSLINVVIIICILHVIGRIFNQQLILQRKAQVLDNTKTSIPAYQHTNRVRAGEGGALISGVGMLILLVVLLFFNINQQISISNTLVVFLGARLQSSVLSNISRSLAKYARSQVVITGDTNAE